MKTGDALKQIRGDVVEIQRLDIGGSDGSAVVRLTLLVCILSRKDFRGIVCRGEGDRLVLVSAPS